MLLMSSFVFGAVHTAPTTFRFERPAALSTQNLTVLSMLQDSKGFVWIGTATSGLYRFDGHRLVRYSSDGGRGAVLPDSRVSALYEDPKGRLWVGTRRGVAKYNPERDDFTAIRSATAEVSGRGLNIKGIIGDGDDGLWIATWNGLQHYSPGRGTFVEYRHVPSDETSIASDDLNALAVAPDGGLFIGTWPGGLDYLPPHSKRFRHFRIDDANDPTPTWNIVRALTFARDGTLWIGTEGGTVRWTASRDWSTRQRLPGATNRITQIYEDHTGRIWGASLGAGMWCWDPRFQKITVMEHRSADPFSLPSNHIRAVMVDRSDMLWIGTLSHGVAVSNLATEGFERFVPFSEDAAQPSNEIAALAGAAGGKLWIGGKGGVGLVDPISGSVIRSFRAEAGNAQGLTSNVVYSLYQEPNGPLWVGTSAGLNALDPKTSRFRAYHFGSVVRDYINAVAPSRDGGLWLGTAGDVVRFWPANGKSISYPHSSDPGSRSTGGTTVLLEDREGRVWMGAEWNGGGLDLLDPRTGKFEHLRHRQDDDSSLPDDFVASIFEAHDGRIWVGTARGLCEVVRAAEGHLQAKSRSFDALIGPDKVFAIREDREGRLWLSTANGIVVFNPVTGKAERFTGVDGVTEGYVAQAAYVGTNGELYFGGMQAIAIVHPELVARTTSRPQLAITDLLVLNTSVAQGKKLSLLQADGVLSAPRHLQLKPGAAVFSIEFAALHFTSPARHKYAYRLEGFDRDWVDADASRRVATYTNLDPGHYVFRVRARDGEGAWTPELSFSVDVSPAWWQTWWFRSSLIVAGLIVLGLTYRQRVRSLTRQRQNLRRLVRDRTRQLEESNARLAALSTTDALTGVLNRRGFDEALAVERDRAARENKVLALLLLDVDHFKRYNDHYGHPAGDACLRAIGAALAACARRPGDVVARYGGEEFALIATFPANGANGANVLGDAICRAAADLGLPHCESPHAVVTVSVGIAVTSAGWRGDPLELLRVADEALYKAKREGRNRFEIGHIEG
jgi:diguanylate cyclase (GGDEF)-like protein